MTAMITTMAMMATIETAVTEATIETAMTEIEEITITGTMTETMTERTCAQEEKAPGPGSCR